MKLGNPRVPSEISALRKLNALAKPDTLNLGLGQPAEDMPSDLRTLAAEVIAKHSLGYTPNAGRMDLRQEIAAFYEIPLDGITVTHGSQEGLMAVLLALLNRGDEVLIPDPGFLAYEIMIRMAGGHARAYPLHREEAFRFDASLILSRLTRKTRAVLVCSPNNPTGTSLAKEERRRLAQELARRKIFLISDDVYGELHFSDPYVPVSRDAKFAVTVNSWSKSLALTGWRIGFTHTRHPTLRKKILAAHQYLTTCASAPAQALMLETLRQPDLYRSILSGYREGYRAKLERLLDALPSSARPPRPVGGFYLFLPVKAKSSERLTRTLLREKNLLVVPGSFFGKNGEGCLRVSVATSDEKIDRAASILADLCK